MSEVKGITTAKGHFTSVPFAEQSRYLQESEWQEFTLSDGNEYITGLDENAGYEVIYSSVGTIDTSGYTGQQIYFGVVRFGKTSVLGYGLFPDGTIRYKRCFGCASFGVSGLSIHTLSLDSVGELDISDPVYLGKILYRKVIGN